MQIMIEDLDRNVQFVTRKQAELDSANANLSRLCLRWLRQQHGVAADQPLTLETSDGGRFLADSAKYTPGVAITVSGYALTKNGQTFKQRRTKQFDIN